MDARLACMHGVQNVMRTNLMPSAPEGLGKSHPWAYQGQDVTLTQAEFSEVFAQGIIDSDLLEGGKRAPLWSVGKTPATHHIEVQVIPHYYPLIDSNHTSRGEGCMWADGCPFK